MRVTWVSRKLIAALVSLSIGSFLTELAGGNKWQVQLELCPTYCFILRRFVFDSFVLPFESSSVIFNAMSTSFR